MKKSASNLEFLDISFIPKIIFVKSRANFKLKYKDCFGFHYFYFDFLPIETNNPSLKELVSITYLTNSFLNHLPMKNPHYTDVPIKW